MFLKFISVVGIWLCCITVQAQVQVVEQKFTVAQDGTGDFKTIQAAVNAVRDHSERKAYITGKKRYLCVTGTTDFIFGEATVVFQDCEIRSLANSYITAASTSQKQRFGYVFFNCKLTANEEATKVYLGRPWRPYAKTAFINTEMGKHILKEGWDPWKGDNMFPEKEKTTFYAEYHSKGEGASPETRVKWSRQLTTEEMNNYTLKNIFGDWMPANI